MKKYLVALFFLTVSGCSATGPVYKAVQPENPENAMVYIYRQNTFTMSARTAYFEIDGKPVAELWNNGYTPIEVSPGQHVLTHSWANWPSELGRRNDIIGIQFEAEPGKSSYLQLEVDSHSYMSGLTTKTEFIWRLRDMAKTLGRKNIQQCRLQEQLGSGAGI